MVSAVIKTFWKHKIQQQNFYKTRRNNFYTQKQQSVESPLLCETNCFDVAHYLQLTDIQMNTFLNNTGKQILDVHSDTSKTFLWVRFPGKTSLKWTFINVNNIMIISILLLVNISTGISRSDRRSVQIQWKSSILEFSF